MRRPYGPVPSVIGQRLIHRAQTNGPADARTVGDVHTIGESAPIVCGASAKSPPDRSWTATVAIRSGTTPTDLVGVG